MRRLSTRLVGSHLAVAVLGGAATYGTVRLLAPRLFDEQLGRGGGPGRPPGQGAMLRQQFADAVDRALLVGTLVGVIAAALFGIAAAARLLRPIEQVRSATRTIASGRYDVRVAVPAEPDLRGLASDVNALAGTLAQTEARRVRLLGEVAHELRTPLTVLDGGLEGMVDGVLPATPDALAGLGVEVRRLRRLADDLSTLSRAEEGRLDLRPVPCDLRAVVLEAAERLRPQAVDAGLQLDCPPGDPVPTRADPDRLAQVVTNLVGNAVRATPPGGAVTVAVSPTGFSVADTGEGLAAADLERVFERFYRVPGRRGGDGSGIGLTLARQIVRDHGGELVATSAGPGRGATFTATLPR